MDKLLSSRNIFIFCVALLLLVLFGWQDILFLRGEEPRRAVVTLEMMLGSDYIVPHINGWPYYNKPPLFNWFMLASYKIFGVSHWSVRFPSLLSLILTSVFFYYFLRKYVNQQVALLSALFYITAGDILFL